MKKIKSSQCRQCGSNDIRLDGGVYICNYCGTVHHDAGAGNPVSFLAGFLGKNRLAITLSVLVTALAVGGLSFIFIGRPATPGGTTISPAGTGTSGNPVDAGHDAIEPEKKVNALFTDISPLPDPIGNIYFVGMLKNNGETPVSARAEIALCDEGDRKVAVARGYGIRPHILPGEKIPISILVTKAPPYRSVRSIGLPEIPTYLPARPKLSISHLKMKLPKHRFDYHVVTGKVTNISVEHAQYVQIAVTVFDGSGRIIGHASNFLGQTVLGPREESPFSVEIHLVKGNPDRFTVDYNAMVYTKKK
jgi:hypothetical protein